VQKYAKKQWNIEQKAEGKKQKAIVADGWKRILSGTGFS
jgi:hypothetical protein